MTTYEVDSTHLVSSVARALVALSEVGDLSAFSMPYPSEAQLAVDRLAMFHLSRGKPTPLGVPGLVRWGRTLPLTQWELDLPADLVGEKDFLIDSRTNQPTSLCVEWASDGGGNTLEAEAWQRMTALLDDCGGIDRYLSCLEFLFERPWIPAAARLTLRGQKNRKIWVLVEKLYVNVPSQTADGRTTSCVACGSLTRRTDSGGWACERDDCTTPKPACEVDRFAAGLVLPLALRRLAGGALRAQWTILRELTGIDSVPTCRIAPEQPESVEITWPDDERWWVVVCDRSSPALLARVVVDRQPLTGRHCVVAVPDSRLTRTPDYRRAFEQCLPNERRGTRLSSVSDVIASAAEHAKKFR
jgi:hypothetical protein